MTCPPAVAVIPARNEETRIATAIAAFRNQQVGVVVVANGCTDRTATAARSAGAHVLTFGRLAGGVGEARALGCAEALRLHPQTRMLLTSDADCRVGADSVAVLRRALASADAAAGRVVPDPVEFAHLPAHVRTHGDLEDLRGALLAEINASIRPSPHDPGPRHGQAPGALLAFRPSAYLAVGGFASMACSEDRDIVRRLYRAGFNVAHPWDAVVVASCRLDGRASGGMADTIASRVASELGEATIRLARQCARLLLIAHALRTQGASAIDNFCNPPAGVDRVG